MAARADDQQRLATQTQQFGLQPSGVVGLGEPGELTSRTRCEQELGHEVEIVEGEVRAARVVNPLQRLAAAIYQPEIDMECDVCGCRRVAAAELSQCSGSYLVVEAEPGNVLQVGALLGGRGS
jgi:hypothetical protein